MPVAKAGGEGTELDSVLEEEMKEQRMSDKDKAKLEKLLNSNTDASINGGSEESPNDATPLLQDDAEGDERDKISKAMQEKKQAN